MGLLSVLWKARSSVRRALSLEEENHRLSLIHLTICYGITGGVAKYLSLINPAKSLDENIIRLFFKTDGYLYDETRNLLTQEFTDVSIANNIVEQIANGETTLNAISTKIKEKENAVCIKRLYV